MKNKFKIATFNLWKDCGEFPSRIEKIGDYLTKLDCICFQEDYHSDSFNSSDTINKTLNMQKYTLEIRKKNRDGILSSSNLTILSKIKPSKIDKLIFDKDGEDERGALIVEIEYNEKNILILNTHLTNFDHKRRMEQIYQIRNYLDKKDFDLIILCGDMNSIPSSKELQCIRQHGFIDYNNNPTYEEGLILDYILSKSKFPIKVKSKILVQSLSDHHCLQNSFKI
jgi:endonuclease/exonuclease/phosphatase family metal-dependent hydrolase